MRRAIALLLASAALPLPAAAARCDEVTVSRRKPMMATLVTVTVRGCEGEALESRIREAFAEMERLAGILSEWDPHSVTSRVNDEAGRGPVAVPRELWEVLEAAQQAALLTSGAFDVTWAALSGLWRFDGKAPRLPLAEDVTRQRSLVGYRDLVLDRAAHTAFLRRPGMRMGLGGLAKGYIAQAAADLLVARGVPDVLVAASGDITARGQNGARPWTVAVKDPGGGTTPLATVELRDESISTAGDYEKFFVVEGKRFHHILDPRTGYPATGTRGVTVVARSGVVADALDTGLLIIGAERGKEVAASAGVSALFVDDRGKVRFSQGAADRFTITRP